MAGLRAFHTEGIREAGCDEAGRGCLAGPVTAAAVVLPPDFDHPLLNDSKQLTHAQRETLRPIIEAETQWAVAFIEPEEIDRINILNASILAMHQAVEQLDLPPELLLIDGNRFHPYMGISHVCVVKGDSIYKSIAAASILAKTHRDACMEHWHERYPNYGWKENKGYPTVQHRKAIQQYGSTPLHRQSFRLLPTT